MEKVAGFARDKNTNMLINTDENAYNQHLRERQRSKEVSTIKQDLERVKADMMALKQLLKDRLK